MKTSRTLSPSLSPIASPFPVRGADYGRRRHQAAARGIQRLAAALVLLAAVFVALPVAAAEPAAQPAGHPGVVNVNTADASQLQQLPRVGPALADRILAFRESNGDFETTEDLILVQGIGEKTYQMLSTFVTVKGETTLTRKLKSSDVPASSTGGGDRG